MNARSVLTVARLIGLELRAEGEELVYRAPKDMLTPGLIEALREFKADMLTLLCEAQDARNHSGRFDFDEGEVDGMSEESMWDSPYTHLRRVGLCSVCGARGRYGLPETATHYCEDHLTQAAHDHEVWTMLRSATLDR